MVKCYNAIYIGNVDHVGLAKSTVELLSCSEVGISNPGREEFPRVEDLSFNARMPWRFSFLLFKGMLF